MILVIDNYDSFTYNLVQMLECLNQAVRVFRNDEIDIRGIKALEPSALVISPGPGAPKESGISVDSIRHFGEHIPVLGVCLGHQAIAEAYGGRVVRAEKVMHGKSSLIFHDGCSIYRNAPNPFSAVRYHSLIVEKCSLPESLEISAWTEDGEIMGLRHREYRVEGLQFHPESILTEEGKRLLRTFIKEGGANNDQGIHCEGGQTRRPDTIRNGGNHGRNYDRQGHAGTNRCLHYGYENERRNGR